VLHAVSLMESLCIVCPQHLRSCSSVIVISVKEKFHALRLLVMAGGVRTCQAEADVWSQPLPDASIRSLPIVRGTPEGTLCTHDKQTTGSSRMDWRDDHGTEATTIQRSRIEKSWRDLGRYGTPSPPLRSLRQRVDACRTALFPPSRQPISSGLLVVSERLQSSNSVTAEAHA
jgi:hypothetical protein